MKQMKNGFYYLFVSAEFKAIQGKRSSNSMLLFTIILISLITLGFGKAMLDYLKVKMDSPFVQFVDINIPLNAQTNLFEELSKSELSERFKFTEPYPIYTSFNNVVASNATIKNAYCRKVAFGDKLFQFITNSSDLMLYSSGGFENFSDDFACISTKEFLLKLGFNNQIPNHLNILVSISDTEDLIIPILIKGVVTNLPDNIDLLLSEKIFDALKYKRPGTFDKLVSTDFPPRYTIVSKELTPEAIEKLSENLNVEILMEHPEYVLLETDYLFDNQMLQKLNRLDNIDTVYRVYNFDLLPSEKSEGSTIDYITFPFTKLDSIFSFTEYLKEAFDLKVDMSVIANKENFRIFNTVGSVLSTVLMAISIVLITLFSLNIILAHIDKNKKNLGTLKAFGLSNGQIISIYTVVSALFIGLVFLSAYVVAELAAPLILQFIIEQILHMNLGTSETRYFIGVGLLEGALFFLAIPLSLVSFNVYRHVKGQTPGDLIYERS